MEMLIEVLNDALHKTYLVLASIPEGLWQFLAFAAAAAAAIGAFLSARATRLTARGQLFSDLLKIYSAEKMYDSLRTMSKLHNLRDKKEQITPNFVRRVLQHRKQNTKSKQPNSKEPGEYKKLELARRHVSHFFQIAFRLFKTKETISKEFFQHICEMSGLKLVYGAVEWLEFAINAEYNRNLFSELLMTSGKTNFELEMLEKLRPAKEFIEKVKDEENEKKWLEALKLLQPGPQAEDSLPSEPLST